VGTDVAGCSAVAGVGSAADVGADAVTSDDNDGWTDVGTALDQTTDTSHTIVN